jgi:hypothetical protein
MIHVVRVAKQGQSSYIALVLIRPSSWYIALPSARGDAASVSVGVGGGGGGMRRPGDDETDDHEDCRG